MKSNAFLPRNRRLLVLCTLSLALHGALLEVAARRLPGPLAPPAAGAPLVMRLADTAAAPDRRRESRLAQAAEKLADAARQAAPAPRPAPPPAAKPRAAPPTKGIATPTIAAREIKAGPSIASDEPELLPVAGGYSVRLPPSVRLSYTNRERPGAEAYLDWRIGNGRYSLEFDGVAGRLSSRGIAGDDGITPVLATENRQDSSTTISFDESTGDVRFGAGGAPAPGALGVQDRASVLVQLAAIALGRPEQLGNEIRIVVAGASRVAVERYQVLGREEVETGIGSMPAWHLARLGAPGEARLELWLAPSQDWLPVRLRLSRADGRVETQTLSGAVRATPAP